MELDPAARAAGTSAERFRARRGRVGEGYFDERAAHVRAAEIVATYVRKQAALSTEAKKRAAVGPTFREVAHAYLDWLERIKGAKPATLRQHRSDLGEPGVSYRRGAGTTNGHVMAALGDLPAARIGADEIDALLETVAATGVSPRTVNRVRDVVRAVFSFGVRSTKFRLPMNPAKDTDRRRTPEPGVLVFFTPEEIESLAQVLESGDYRGHRVTRDLAEEFDDRRDAEAVRVAAYSGLRLGEQLALRWRDIDWAGSVITISRAVSAGVEGPTKTGHVRRAAMADQTAAALKRLAVRPDFTSPDDYVFCNAYGRRLDGSALRRRYKHARDKTGLRPLRWHDLRHTFGSLLVAGGVDLVSVQDAMGHIPSWLRPAGICTRVPRPSAPRSSQRRSSAERQLTPRSSEPDAIRSARWLGSSLRRPRAASRRGVSNVALLHQIQMQSRTLDTLGDGQLDWVSR